MIIAESSPWTSRRVRHRGIPRASAEVAFFSVIPAQAGIQSSYVVSETERTWMPVFTGMTKRPSAESEDFNHRSEGDITQRRPSYYAGFSLEPR
jgi:hypothetical protein